MKILLMGPPACGKGTQGEMLSKWMKIPLISVGGLLRNLDPKHPRYAEIQELMKKGDLVPFDFAAEQIVARLGQADCRDGYILDGWARDKDNLSYFDPKPDNVLVISIPREESVRRISGRRTCDTDGKVYNIYLMPKEGLTECQGHLTQRADDTEEVVNARLDLYFTDTTKVIAFFRNLGLVREIDGMGTPEEVFERIQTSMYNSSNVTRPASP